MRQRRYVAVAAAVVALAGCGSSGGSKANAPANSVTIRQIAFHPPTLDVKVGDTVTWRFADNGVLHTVTADDASFDSGQHGSGQFTHIFDKAGTFKYHCSIHATMTGSIVVS